MIGAMSTVRAWRRMTPTASSPASSRCFAAFVRTAAMILSSLDLPGRSYATPPRRSRDARVAPGRATQMGPRASQQSGTAAVRAGAEPAKMWHDPATGLVGRREMPERNRQIVLSRRPNGMPVPEDFAIAEGPLPEPGEGEVVLRAIYLSLDPYMRGRISGVRSYARPTEIGEVIEGRVVGRVARSNHPDFREGDYASGGYGWQLYSAVPASGLLLLDPAEAPISTALGVLGMPGMTAYIGLADIGQPKAGETVVVAAASGAVGAVAGQLAKRQGARVVGIAGGAEKCRYVKEELGFDAALDHH